MLRRATLITLALVAPAIAAAQSYHRGQYGPPPTGATLSAWLGFGVPTGKFSNEGDGDVRDVVSSSVPIGFGAYYRFNPNFRLGGFFEIAPLSIDDSACGGASCDGVSYRFGVEGQYHFTPHQRADVWLGLGLGYESTNLHAEFFDPASNTVFLANTKFTGLLFPRIIGGVDFAVSPRFTLGPYASWTGGQYDHVDDDVLGSAGIHDKSYHGWFELGIRGNFNM